MNSGEDGGWENPSLYDWSIIRPNYPDNLKQQAIEFARSRANSLSVSYDILAPMNSENTTYCSLLVWQAYSSVGLNLEVVEGYKLRGWQGKIRFYNIAEASLEEVKYYLLLATELTYLKQTDALDAQAATVGRMLYRFIESTNQNRNRQPPPNP